MCALLLMLITGPRFVMLIWYLIAPRRWENAFDTVLWPVLGFVFFPWTTLMFVIVAPSGNIEGSDWAWLALAFVVDWFTSLGGGLLNRRRFSSTTR